jgi:hypothetical protein
MPKRFLQQPENARLEAVSKISKHRLKAGEMDEAEEVFEGVLPASDKAAEVVHPGEEPLQFPTFAITAQFASILGGASVAALVRGDQLNAVFRGELFTEWVRVVGFAAD